MGAWDGRAGMVGCTKVQASKCHEVGWRESSMAGGQEEEVEWAE